MPTVFEADGGRIRMWDTSGNLRFDTEERIFTVTNSVSGSIGLSAYTAQNRNGTDLVFINVDTLHALASINSAADTVRGSFSVTAGGNGVLTGLGWFNASGSYLHFFDAIPPVSAGGGGDNSLIAQMAIYTFIASGGTLYIHERVQLKATISTSSGVTNSVTMLAPSFSYNLLVGTFI